MPSLQAEDYRRPFMRTCVQIINVRQMVPNLSDLSHARPDVVPERYRSPAIEQKQQMQDSYAVDLSEQVIDEGVVVNEYQGAWSVAINVPDAGRESLPEESGEGKHLKMRTVVVEPTELFRVEAQVP